MATMIETEAGASIFDSYGATRTKALPKTTLFGSALEMQTETQRKEVKEVNLAEVDEKIIQASKQTRPWFKIDVDVSGLPEKRDVSQSKRDFVKHKSYLNDTEKQLRLLEEKSKYFRVGVHERPEPLGTPESKDEKWFSKKDLKHADEINRIGFGKSNRSFNHDKYKLDEESHKYRLLGNVLKPGNDFVQLPNKKSALTYKKVEHKEKRYKLEPFLQATEPNIPLPLDLPPNIQHQFGSKICNQLLQDKDIVDKALETQKHKHHVFYKKHFAEPRRIDLSKNTPDTTYDKLGNTFRTNIFPGYTHGHKKSLAHSVYTKEVYDNRPPVPDEHRYQRDELSKWAERNIIMERARKAWDNYLSDPKK